MSTVSVKFLEVIEVITSTHETSSMCIPSSGTVKAGFPNPNSTFVSEQITMDLKTGSCALSPIRQNCQSCNLRGGNFMLGDRGSVPFTVILLA